MTDALELLMRIPTELLRDAEESLRRHTARALALQTDFDAHLAASAPDDSASAGDKRAFAQWLEEIRAANEIAEPEAREKALGAALTRIKDPMRPVWEAWASEAKCGWAYNLGLIFRDDLSGCRKDLKIAQEKMLEFSALQALINKTPLTTAAGESLALPPLFIGRVTSIVGQQEGVECGFCAAWTGKEFLLEDEKDTFFERILQRGGATGFKAAKAHMLGLSGTRMQPGVGRVPFTGIPNIDIESEYLWTIVQSFADPAIPYASRLKDFTPHKYNPAIERLITADGITRLEGIYMPEDERETVSKSTIKGDFVGVPLLTHEALAQRLVDNAYVKCAQIFNNSELYRVMNPREAETPGGHWVTLGVIQYAFGPGKDERVRLYFPMDSATTRPKTILKQEIAATEIEFIRRAFPELIKKAIAVLRTK